MRIWRSGSENVAKELESGESVIHVGVDFDYVTLREREMFLQSPKRTYLLKFI